MKHHNILLIGGSGFIGSHVAAQLVAAGKRVTVLTRRRDRARTLFLLPTVDVVEGDPFDSATLAHHLVGQDALINLVGILHGSRGASGASFGPEFRRAHVELVEVLVAACQRAGVARLLQLSSLGASSDAPSMYLRSKAAGEDVLRASTLGWTIFRPSIVFGPKDRFLNLFAALQKWLPVIPLACAEARFEPVFVEDVARAIVSALDADAALGNTYELVGPRVYSLRELVRFAGVASGHPRKIIGLPPVLGRLQATFMEFMPGPTIMSRDNVRSMSLENVSSGRYAGLEAEELGGSVETFATPLEPVAAQYLSGAHQRAHFDAFRVNAHR